MPRSRGLHHPAGFSIAPRLLLALVVVSVATILARAQVVTYECDVFPEQAGWERVLADTPGADRSIVDGVLLQSVSLPEGWTGPLGDAEFYRISLAEFAGVEAFFVEWRATTTNPSWLLDLSQTPAAVSCGGSGEFYSTTVTDSEARLFRGTAFPLVFPPLEPGVYHTIRLELIGGSCFTWYVDGLPVESGTPGAAYPDQSSELIWGVRRSYVDAVTRWDYIRFGVIPKDGSGDYDSDGAVSAFDYYFAAECMDAGGPGHDAGPGCRFADFDGDSDTDLADFAAFQLLFSE